MAARLIAGADSKDCTKCGLTLPIDAFYIRPDGRPRPECRACKRKHSQADRVKNREYLRQWRKKNSDRTKATARLRYARTRKKEIAWRMRKQAADPAAAMLIRARVRAKKFGLPFSITKADIVIPPVCPVMGVPFGPLGRGRGAKADSMSLDRIIPALGYVPGNVQVICQKANWMKNNATPEQLRKFALWVLAS